MEEYEEVVERLGDTGVDMLEINVSCPNVKEGAIAFGQNADSLYAITSQIKKKARQPVIMKLSPNVTDIAAIASAGCADLYGLHILTDRVSNTDHNYTRFICISKNLEIFEGASRITFVASASHRPGSLYSLIAKFATRGINISKLESRPIPGKDFEFRFYFDVDASVSSHDVQTVLSQLEKEGFFTFLGAYSEVF